MKKTQTKKSNTQSKRQFINEIQETLKPWNLRSINSFQYLFPFQKDLEKIIGFMRTNILDTHNAIIEYHLNIFPKTTNAYWQIYRRNLYHSRVQIPNSADLSIKDLDIKTAEQFIKLHELIGKSEKTHIATSSRTPTFNKIQDVRYISIKIDPKYKLLEKISYKGILAYVFKNSNNDGEKIKYSFFDLNSQVVPLLKKYN